MMTKKKFIKTFRAYGLNRNEINMLVNKIVDKKGKLSYNDAIKEMWLKIVKMAISKYPWHTIDFDIEPPEQFVDTDAYKMDYRLFSIDLANEPDRTVFWSSTN